jgi:hypothetical protein
MSYKFVAPSVDQTGGFTYYENLGSGGARAPIFMTITSNRCDFDATKTYGNVGFDSCYASFIGGGGITWNTSTGSIFFSQCRLVKGNSYYVNIRFQDARPITDGGNPTASSCPSGLCGGSLHVN